MYTMLRAFFALIGVFATIIFFASSFDIGHLRLYYGPDEKVRCVNTV